MTFLPIVDRELRVASRKRMTFWVRITAAVTAFAIGTGFHVLGTSFGAATSGRPLFMTLSWLALAVALCSGLFLTSDCLSEEKREGTLGLLFLTRLRGYDVVLGKLAATSLRGAYALLAVLPVMALSVLMGGVSGAQFWQTVVALLSALFVSLAAGLFVSALCRDSQAALGGTLALLIFLAGAGLASDGLLGWILEKPVQPLLSFFSPVHLFLTAGGGRHTPFYVALAVNLSVGWGLLAVSCWLLPRTWGDKSARSAVEGGWKQRWRFGNEARRRALRIKLLSLNPALWLACRERWQAAVFWGVAVILWGGLSAIGLNDSSMWWTGWTTLGGLLVLVLYLGMASQAARLFVDAQRSGVFELLLVTPLTPRQVVMGQWRGLVRTFGWPLALCLGAQFAGNVMAQRETWKQLAAMTAAATPPPAPAGTNAAAGATNISVVSSTTVIAGSGQVATLGPDGMIPGVWLPVAVALIGLVVSLANFVALAWVGMWMGLRSRSTNLASLKSLSFVQVIPWFVISFVSTFFVGLVLFPWVMRGSSGGMINWYPILASVVGGILFLAKDIAFFVWARRKLFNEFRQQVRGVRPV